MGESLSARVRVIGSGVGSARFGTHVAWSCERILNHLDAQPPGTAVTAVEMAPVLADGEPVLPYPDCRWRSRATNALRVLWDAGWLVSWKERRDQKGRVVVVRCYALLEGVRTA